MSARESIFSSLVQQLINAPREQVQSWPLNPFPKGIRPGSSTDRILVALQAAHPRWLERFEIMRIAQCSRGGADWGVAYLAERGLVRSIRSFRSQRYRRYQATMKEIEPGTWPARATD